MDIDPFVAHLWLLPLGKYGAETEARRTIYDIVRPGRPGLRVASTLYVQDKEGKRFGHAAYGNWQQQTAESRLSRQVRSDVLGHFPRREVQSKQGGLAAGTTKAQSEVGLEFGGAERAR